MRAFRAVGGTPAFIIRGEGPQVIDADDGTYVDYIGAWGPLILGHAHPEVIRAVTEAAGRGLGFGTPVPAEIELATLVTEALPSVDRLRFVCSGTEAAMSAIRVARAATHRRIIVKFEGCYHGHADGLLAKAGSGLASLGIPASSGVPDEVAALTITVPYNKAERLDAVIEAQGDEVAAVIVEPIAGNMGVVLPSPGFLDTVCQATWRCGAVVIFDEVITGFRVAWGGAQRRCNVRPDLTLLGKVIGGGLPVAAYGGRPDLMQLVAPEGPVYQAGTLAGNPVALQAGIATLAQLRTSGTYERLEALGAQLQDGVEWAARRHGVALTVNRVGSMLTPFFAAGPIRDFQEARRADTRAYARFFHGLLSRGVLVPPSQFESWFVSLAHDERALAKTVDAIDDTLGGMSL